MESSPYLESVLAGLPLKLVSVSPTKGRGVISTAAFQPSQIIFQEKPLLSMQQSYNRALLTVPQTCENCLKFIGTFDEFLHLIEFRVGIRDDAPSVSGSVPCMQGCGELYCSDKCREESWEKHHNRLCVGPLEKEHPLVAFKEWSIQMNDNFLMAAKAIVGVLNQATKTGLENALHPYTKFHQFPWEQVVRARGDIKVEKMQKRLTKAYELLKAGLYSTVSPQEQKLLDGYFTTQFYFGFFGIFDVTTQSIEITNPIQTRWEELKNEDKECQESQRINKLVKAIEDYSHMPSSDEDIDEPSSEHEDMDLDNQEHENEPFAFSKMDGIGLFTIISLTNHSCDPNCIVLYDKDYTANVIALKPIKPGDEIVHSYIENENGKEQRHKDLAVYCFTCDCEKCLKNT